MCYGEILLLAVALDDGASLSLFVYSFFTKLLGITVTCLCYLVAFEYVCSAFTLVRRHGKTKDGGQLFVNLSFSQFLIRTCPGQSPFIPNMLV